MLQSLKIIKERLKTNGYDKVQYLPSRRSIAIGKEFYVFRSFFYKRNPCIFHSTCFHTLYHLIFRSRYPWLYNLYRIFFLNEPKDAKSLFKIFTAREIASFVKDGILIRDGRDYKFDFRFVPFEDLFLVARSDVKDVKYVHVNYDSITFVESIRRMKFKRFFKRALEIGCGAGLASIEIAKFSKEVDAVDINPHAVTAMGINAALNGISNINTLLSNCYDDIKEKYDLIVSDPPFELMPKGQRAILHRYGGSLGMDVALRIFSGLDEHLTADGEAVVFTNSYIKNFKIDTLKDALFDMFKDKKFEITLYPLSYQINPEFYSVYHEENITHSVAYTIRLRRANGFKMAVVPLRFLDKIKEVSRVIYLYLNVLVRGMMSDRV